jgi:hypothetical protein
MARKSSFPGQLVSGLIENCFVGTTKDFSNRKTWSPRSGFLQGCNALLVGKSEPNVSAGESWGLFVVAET